MKAEIDLLSAVAGEVFERDFLGASEIVVRREGHSRARHLFLVDGRLIARLKWRGLRRAVYEADGERFYLSVGALDRRISITTADGSESLLIERARANPNQEDLRVEMAEGDDFCANRSCSSRRRGEESILVHKRFYQSTLLAFRFNTLRRTPTTVRIEIKPTMKWEARFLHRLLALLVCRIILDRRHSGAPLLKLKEKPCPLPMGRRKRRRL